MANKNALDLLYNKRKSALEFNFDSLVAPPLLSLLTVEDINELHRIAKSVKLSGKIDKKYELIDLIMRNRGFVKLHAGTNRVVYRFLEDQRFVVKIAVDRVGLGDNPAEFKNQFLLKPFVTKVFEVSPCGTVAIVERVEAVMSREEFMSIADSVFNLITKFLIGKYVLEDFGSHYFMNYGIRPGFGPVLLDYPYVFEIDGEKLYCNAKPIPSRKDIRCHGEIDYDDGFNNLVCTKCRRMYSARDLSVKSKEKLIIVGGKKKMRVQVLRGDTVIKDNKQVVSKVIEQPKGYESTSAKFTVDNSVVEQPREDKPKPPVNHYKKFYYVQGRNNEIIKADEDNKMPSESILKESLASNKVENDTIELKDAEIKTTSVESNQEPVEENKDEVVDNATTSETEETTGDDMNSELNRVLHEYRGYDDEDDEYEEYDQYLNNRQRSNKVKPKMKSSKKNNFNGF